MLRDPEPQTASGKVLWHFSMTLDGFIAGPEHSMDWMTGFTGRPGVEEEYVQTTGAVLAGRDAFDSAIRDSRPYSATGRARSSCSRTTPRTPGPPRGSRS